MDFFCLEVEVGWAVMMDANSGLVVTHVKFETGSDELRALEQKVYVASGRFVIEEGKPLVVEYKISQVTA